MLNYVVFIVFLVLAVICFVIAFLLGNSARKKIECCTEKVLGKVVGISRATYNDLHLPLVEYEVDGKTYNVVGPKFAGVTIKSFSIAGTNIGKSDTNLTVDGELPNVVHMNTNSQATLEVLAKRYPEGTKVDVYYDPNKPKRAYVERYAKINPLFTIYLPAFVGIISMAIGIIIIVVKPI